MGIVLMQTVDSSKMDPTQIKKTSTIVFLLPPRLSTYLQNNWSHKNGSPIDIRRIKQGIPLQWKLLFKQLLYKN